MKTQFYYALLDIGSEWRKIIKFIFQMLLSLLAFMYIVSSIFQQLGFSQWLQGKADYCKWPLSAASRVAIAGQSGP